VVIEWKGGDESAERGSVHDEKQGTKNGALGTPQEEVADRLAVPLSSDDQDMHVYIVYRP